MNEDALILVVEDDDNDAFLLQDAFRRAGILNPVKVLANAEQAMDYLLGHGPYANRDEHPMPSIIFTDLHLSTTGGLELVRWLKAHPAFAAIPVIAMTGSGSIEDEEEALQAGANLAFGKPVEHSQLVEDVKLICDHVLVT